MNIDRCESISGSYSSFPTYTRPVYFTNYFSSFSLRTQKVKGHLKTEPNQSTQKLKVNFCLMSEPAKGKNDQKNFIICYILPFSKISVDLIRSAEKVKLISFSKHTIDSKFCSCEVISFKSFVSLHHLEYIQGVHEFGKDF